MFHPKGPSFFELARQALSSTQEGYDLLAPKFDYTPYRTPEFLLEPIAAEIGPPDSVPTALDVCCGTGAGMEMLRPMVSERLTGFDMSRNMLDQAKENLAHCPGSARLEFIRGDALDMPFRDEFDVAVCFGALGHILPKDERRFIDQIAASLRSGGRFVFVTSYMPSIISPNWWLARSFNAAMRIRNLLISPPFIMYYLTFLLPEIQTLLEQRGFEVEVREGVFGKRIHHCKLVVATLR